MLGLLQVQCKVGNPPKYPTMRFYPICSDCTGNYQLWLLSLVTDYGRRLEETAQRSCFFALFLRLPVVHGSLRFAEAFGGQWPFRGAMVALSVC